MFVSKSRPVLARIARAAAATNRVTLPSRGFVSATNVMFEKLTISVPTMGDSITEGTIVEWLAQVGQKVEEDDVVALIETDKVTVDIKATQAGVITQQFGAIDDEVEVGAELYEIDTEAEATVEASSAAAESTPTPEPVAAAAPEPTPVEAPATTSSSTTSSPPERVPSIKFLGKEGWQRALTVEPDYVIPATYGRLDFSEDEIEALLSGGANLAPEVEAYSTGATFSA